MLGLYICAELTSSSRDSKEKGREIRRKKINAHRSHIVYFAMSHMRSAEFEQFLALNGIRHIPSSPYHPASNGQAKQAVQTVKKGGQKMQPGLLTDHLGKFLPYTLKLFTD